VPRFTDEEIERLQALAEEQARHAALGNVEAFFHANAAFHELIVAASGNRTLEEMHRQLVGHMGRYRMRSLVLRGTLKRSVGEHRAILRAIKARDAEKAAELLGEHIHVPQQRLESAPEEVVLTP
jgi:DNA-binding GntR family transcriptional regulator